MRSRTPPAHELRVSCASRSPTWPTRSSRPRSIASSLISENHVFAEVVILDREVLHEHFLFYKRKIAPHPGRYRRCRSVAGCQTRAVGWSGGGDGNDRAVPGEGA